MPLFSKKIIPTEITSNIEKAVNPSVTELDWTLVFQICDAVNSTELGAKEARKLLQKKMMSHDPKLQFLALEILNSLAENCSEKFQTQLCAKSFGEDLLALSSFKTLDDRVRGKLTQCLETWIRQTRVNPQSGAIKKAYDTMISLHGGNSQPSQILTIGNTNHAPRKMPTPTDMKDGIEVAKNSAQLFSQTLSFTDPTKEDISKNDLIQEFYSKCKQSQQLLAFYLEICEDSELISALINANNELLNCFRSYDEMLEQRAVNEATVNSQTLFDRNIHNNGESFVPNPNPNPHHLEEENNNITDNNNSNDNQIAAKATNPFQVPQINFNSNQSMDPFDPFADTNHVQADINSANISGNNVLPPPLTPKKLHD
ncbi:uncharacterized protein BX663DRAFT_482262 [Cokeromyces recurvatus]|uniref:uncharacterized protein n=1 Tax=Cokeromyces recurvatus TaxID=90255 RepID=UPI00221F26DD|nr:uncharacterized protein BX663DRAFT_482262 [Cokeromyces recurvatus]KAI7908028.1 hypothetical protein BX663DRAFT_482262 [Cokeromyces recurvatus]